MTPNNKRSEKTFEDVVLETGGKFWKSLPIKNVLNKDIAGKIFDITRPIEKKFGKKNVAKDGTCVIINLYFTPYPLKLKSGFLAARVSSTFFIGVV